MNSWLSALTLPLLFEGTIQVDSAANAANTEITTPVSGVPQDSSILDATSATFIIEARDSLGDLAGDSENIWVELNKEGTCEIGYGTINCQVLCYPFTAPHVAAKQCESSHHTKGRVTESSDTALWVVADVQSTGSSQYTVTYHDSVEVSTDYVVSAFLLTNGGLYGRYWDNVLLTGTESLSGIASEINYQWGADAAITTYGQDYVSARWEGKIMPPYDETYKFYLYADDGARLWIDKQLIIDGWDECCNETWGAVNMTSSSFHDIIVEYREIRGEAYIELRWSSDSIAKTIVPSNYLYYQTHITDSPFDASPINIAPGDVSYTQTYVGDASPFSGNTAGVNNSVQVTATDAFGHVLPSDSAVFDLTDFDMTSTQQWEGDGVYTITFMRQGKTDDAGLPFEIQIDGDDIVGSPFTVTVSPAATAPLNTSVGGPGLTSAIAGYTAQFNMTVFDEFGNERESDGDSINVRFSGAAAGHGVCEYLSIGQGTYLCSYTLTVTGSYDIELTVNGVIIPNSYSISVSPGEIHGPTCNIYNTTLLDITLLAGYSEFLTIQSRDQFGNELSTTTDDYVVNISDGTVSINASVTSLGAGQYNLSFTPTVSGVYQVSILLDNITDIEGSPYTLTVLPGDPVASTSSVIDGTGHSSAQSDVETNFVVQIRDAFSNDLDSAVSTNPVFDTAVLACDTVDTTVSCSYDQSGQYLCTYTPTESGACTLDMEMSGVPITGSPFSVAVSPGEISATTCFAHGISDGMAGVYETFTIQAQDVHGNNLTSGGHTFVAVLVDTHSVYPDVAADITDNTDGTYTARYVTEDANLYEALNVKLVHFGGLLANYYTDYAFNNVYAVNGENVVDSELSFDWGFGPPLLPTDNFPASDYFSIQWVGFLNPPYSETYTIYTSIYGGTGVRLYMDGDVVIDQFDPLDGESDPFVMIQLTANTLYQLRIDFREKTGSSKFSLEWESASIQTRTTVDPQYLYYEKNIFGNNDDFVANVSIIPSPTLASTSSITGDGLSTAVAGVQSTLSIVAKDQYGNTQTDAGNEEGDFIMYLEDESLTQVNGVVHDAGNDGADGQYTATYTITDTSQQYTLYITYKGANVASSPYTVSVTPGVLSASQSSAVLLDGRAGETQTFDLYVRDTESNLIDDRSVSVALILSHSASSTDITTTDIVDHGDGIYTISYNATLSGEYVPSISMDAAVLTDITPAINISNAIASASESYVVGWSNGADSPITASVLTQKTIQLIDIYSNDVSVSGGYNFYVTLNDLPLDHENTSVADQALVAAGPAGTYTIDFTAPSAGTYYLNVMLASGDISTPDGMTGEYFNNRWLHGTAYSTQIDANCSLDWEDQLVTATAKDSVSIRWSGYIQPSYAETYTFTITSDDGSALYVDNQLIFDHFQSNAGSFTGTHTFGTAGLLYPLRIEYRENTGNANFIMEWSSASLSPPEVVPQSVLFADAVHIKSSPFTLTVED